MLRRNAISSFAIGLMVAAGSQSAAASSGSAGPNWSGLFFGVQAGYEWSDADWLFPELSLFSDPGARDSYGLDGALAGGHLTFNRQVNSFVWGIELSLRGGSVDGTTVGTLEPLYFDDSFTTRIGTHGTVTGRLGYALGDVLIYGKGGFAAGEVSFNAEIKPTPHVVAAGKKTHTGWTIGAGIDYLLTPNVAFGVQYDYIRLGGETYDMRTQGPIAGARVVAVVDDIDLHSVTARLSIKLAP